MLHFDNASAGFFEREQFEAVRRHLPEHLRPLVTAGYLTGWRRGELLSRQWRHVDLKEGWLRLEVHESKNGKGRAFPINALPELRELLLAQRERITAIEVKDRIDHPVGVRQPRRLARSLIFERLGAPPAARPVALGACSMISAAPQSETSSGWACHGRPGWRSTGHLTASIYGRYSIVDSTMLVEAVEKLASQMSDQKSPSSVKVSTLPVKRAGKNP